MKTSMIGVLFIAALALVLYLGITLSGAGSLGEFFGEEQQIVRLEFDQVTGLKKRDEVFVSGLTVGRVQDLELQNDGSVLVTCAISPKANIFKDASAEIIPLNALGGRSVSIMAGTRSMGAYDGNETIEGIYVDDLLTAGGRVIGKVGAVVDTIGKVADDLKVMSEDLREGRGVAGMLIANSETRDDVQNTIKKLYDTVVAAQSAAEGLDAAMREVNTGKGAAHQIIFNEESGKDLTKAVTAGRETLENFREASKDVAEVARKANEGNGVVAKLLNDKKLANDTSRLVSSAADAADNVNETFIEAHMLVKNVNEGNGTVGRLFNDDALYNDLLRTVNTLQASFEDLREQAPVTTFASVIFQVFQ